MCRKIMILLCSMIFGFCVTGCLFLPLAGEAGSLADRTPQPVCSVSWWSLMYEPPNPEKLPVQIRFRWLKGLE